MTDQEILAIAHRTATVYRHRSDPESPSYGFLNHTIIEFARRIEQAATAAALERAALVRMKLPPAKYGGNVSAIQCVYQDAFDRGWKAGISAMRSSIRALKDKP